MVIHRDMMVFKSTNSNIHIIALVYFGVVFEYSKIKINLLAIQLHNLETIIATRNARKFKQRTVFSVLCKFKFISNNIAAKPAYTR
jgi:hypothetical protein